MKKYVILLIGCIISSCSNGQITMAKNGIEITKDNLNEEQVKLLFNNTKSFPNNTQLAIAVIRKGEINFVGIKRINDTIKLVENHDRIFEIGSITKVFTATLLANYVVDKRLQLEDDIQDFLDFKLNTEESITFKQLANHTSGLPRMPSNLNMFAVDPNNPYKAYDSAQLTEYLTSEIKLNNEPGTAYEYSNLGAGILGFELAIIANSTYENLLQEKIFQKYKMQNSTSRRSSIKGTLVKGLKPYGDPASNWDFDALAGGGAIFSTVEDLSNFALAQFDSQNKELSLSHRPTFKMNESMSIGLGWHLIKRKNGGELIWHNGGTGGYSSSMALNLLQENGIIILSNVSAFNKNMGNIDQVCFELINSLDK